MEDNTPLDQFAGANLTVQEVMKRLQDNGIYEIYENNSGHIIVSDDKALDCTLIPGPLGNWRPEIKVKWDSAQALLPAIVVFILGNLLFKSMSLVISGLLGWGIGTLLVNKRKKAMHEKLNLILNR